MSKKKTAEQLLKKTEAHYDRLRQLAKRCAREEFELKGVVSLSTLEAHPDPDDRWEEELVQLTQIYERAGYSHTDDPERMILEVFYWRVQDASPDDLAHALRMKLKQTSQPTC